MAAEGFYFLYVGENRVYYLPRVRTESRRAVLRSARGFPGFQETDEACLSDRIEYAGTLHSYLSRFEKKILLLTIIYHKFYNKGKIKKFKRSESIISGKAGDSYENDRIRT